MVQQCPSGPAGGILGVGSSAFLSYKSLIVSSSDMLGSRDKVEEDLYPPRRSLSAPFLASY